MTAEAESILTAAEQKAQQRSIEAEEDAASVRSKAAEEAEALRAETEAGMNRAKERFETTLARLNNDTASEYRLLLQTAQRSLSQTIAEIEGQVASVGRKLSDSEKTALVTSTDDLLKGPTSAAGEADE